VDPEAQASHIVVTAKGAKVFHDACALTADARIAFHEKDLMEDVVAAAREVDVSLERLHLEPRAAGRDRRRRLREELDWTIRVGR
jgi:hypothetical protein